MTPFCSLFRKNVIVQSLCNLSVMLTMVLLKEFPLSRSRTPNRKIKALSIKIIRAFCLRKRTIRIRLLLCFFRRTRNPLLQVRLFNLLRTINFMLLRVRSKRFRRFLFISPLQSNGSSVFRLRVRLGERSSFAEGTLMSFPRFSSTRERRFFFTLVRSFLMFGNRDLISNAIHGIRMISRDKLFVTIFFSKRRISVIRRITCRFQFHPMIFRRRMFLLCLLYFFGLRFNYRFLRLLRGRPFCLLNVPFRCFLSFDSIFRVLFLTLLPSTESYAILSIMFRTGVRLSNACIFQERIRITYAREMRVLSRIRWYMRKECVTMETVVKKAIASCLPNSRCT